MRDSVPRRDVREAILDATDLLLSRYGYRKMTIDDLAAEVGIGKGSVYLHFKSKEEIALSHIDRVIERVKNRISEIAQRDIPVDERIKLMLVERVMFRFASVQHYTQSLNDMLAQIRPKLLERRKRYFEEESRIFATVVGEGVKSGTFSAGDPVDAARSLLVATNSLLPFSLTTRELGEQAEIEQRVKTLADMLLRGLCSRD